MFHPFSTLKPQTKHDRTYRPVCEHSDPDSHRSHATNPNQIDAQAKADAIIAKAQVKTDELVSEHQIMQQAYAQANEVVMIATKQAQEILDNATNDANNIRMGAMQYTDDILRNLEISISHAMDSAKARHENYMSSLQEFYDVVSSNRAELNPTAEDAVSDSTENLPKIDISSDMLK